MTRILAFGDPHITLHNEFSKPTEDGLTTYLQECLASFKWLAGVIEVEQPDAVVCLGDVFDSTGSVDTRSLVVAVRCFTMLTWVPGARDYHLLVGNHDLYDHNHKLHSLEWLRERWHVYDQPVGWSDGLFIPWTKDEGLVREVLEKYPGVPVFTHLEINGSQRNGQGVPFEDKGFPQDLFRGRAVFNGHYHSPNTVIAFGAKPTTVRNIGALHSRTFNDVGSPPRGCVLIDTKGSGDVRFIENPTHIFYRDAKLVGEVFDVPDDRVNARVYYRAGEEDAAQAFAGRLHNARLIPVGGDPLVVREESLAPVHTPAENLQSYLELQLPDITDPDLYMALDEYAQWLVGRVPAENIPQHIEVRSLYLQNFMSVGEATVTYSKGVFLVEGENQDDPTMASNGSGKTVVTVEALYWLLTGTTLRKVPVDEVVKEDCSGCVVKGDLLVGPDQYLITRTRNNEGKFLGALTISKNGVPIEVRKGKDSEGKLAEVLKLSPTRLFQTMLLTADLQSRFSQLGPTDRLKVIEEMGGVTMYDDLRLICKADRDVKDRQYTELRFKAEALAESIPVLEGQVARAQEDLEFSERKAQEHLALIDDEKARVVAEAKALTAELQALDMAPVVNRVPMEAKLAEVRKEASEAQTKARDFSAQALAAQAEVTRLESLKGKCPTCGQDLPNAELTLRMLDQAKTHWQILLDGATAASSRARVLAEQAEGLLTEVTKLRAEGDNTARQASMVRANLTRVDQTLLQNERSRKMVLEQATRLQETLDRYRAALAKAKQDQERVTEDRDAAERALKIAGWWLEALGTAGIRAFINEQSLRVVNERLKDYSPRILGPKLGTIYLSSYRETQKGDISNKIDIKLSGGRTFGKLSSGQKRRVDLAIQFALNDLACGTSTSGSNLLICDEILDPIDELGCRGVVEILREKGAKLHIFVTTHNAALKALQFDGRWTVRLQGGTSTLLGGNA